VFADPSALQSLGQSFVWQPVPTISFTECVYFSVRDAIEA